MINQDFLDFFRDLSENNNRDWFEKNKKRYEKSVKQPFVKLVEAIIAALKPIEPELNIEAKDTIFRINRDVRFSKDKSPYKTNTGANISIFGRKNHEYPGYYIHLEYGMAMFGGGAYTLEKESLEKIRQHILFNPERFKAVITAPDFVQFFGSIKGEQNKKLPPQYAEILGNVPEIANKQFYFMAEMQATEALKPDFVEKIAEMSRAAKPVNDFLAQALTNN